MAAAGAAQTRSKRQFLFSLTDAERASPDEHVDFVSKLPMYEKRADPNEEEDMKNARVALINILDTLWRKPHLAVACNTWLQTRMANELKPKGEGYFKTAPAMVKLIDEDWLAGFLVRHSKMSQQALEQAAVFDPMTPYHFLCYAIRSSTHMKLDKRFICKATLGYTLEYLMEKCGDRLKETTDAIMPGNGAQGVEWGTKGVYRSTFDESGWAMHLTHSPSNTTIAVPEHAKVHTSFTLTKNWSDYEAAVKKRPSDILLHTYFDDNVGPHSGRAVTANSVMMKEAIEQAVKEQEKHAKLISAAAEPGAKRFKADHKQSVKQASISRAQTALKAKQAELNDKRVVSLASVSRAGR